MEKNVDEKKEDEKKIQREREKRQEKQKENVQFSVRFVGCVSSLGEGDVVRLFFAVMLQLLLPSAHAAEIKSECRSSSGRKRQR